jgi:3-hydroxyisobutyrate dehydrogenase-like beta-hydroxyacid dehydrogenase
MQSIQTLQGSYDSHQWQSMTIRSLIGFGEAGQAFAVAPDWRAFDIDPERTRSVTLDAALDGADLILSVVTADQALVAAQRAASCIAAGALYCDMNSVAPATKQAAAAAIEATGGHYVDVAVMSPVNPKRLATPLLVSGPHAAAGFKALRDAGFADVRIVGDTVGRASTIKMLRSVMYKGMEALTAECLMACAQAGVTEEVLASLGGDWADGADYRFDRMMVHGPRRAAEMREVIKTLESLGVPSRMTLGTVFWEDAIGEQKITHPPDGLDAKLAALAGAMS